MAYLTYFDLVESLVVSSFGGPQDAEQRDIRTAVQRAYSEVTTAREWSHYYQHGRVITQVPYGTGTVAFNASTNQLTLTGGTWPSWANLGHVTIGSLVARVSEVSSPTVLKMDSTLTFPATLAAGQAYTLFRSEYPLPADFRNMDEPSNEYNWWSGMYLRPDDAMKMERVGGLSGKPWHWTVLRNPSGSGHVLKLVGYPTTQETLDFTYRRSPRQMRWSGHEPAARFTKLYGGPAGGVDVGEVLSADSPPLQPFDSSMPGSILRVGRAISPVFPGPLESMSPYSSEFKILSVDSLINDLDLLEVDGSPQFSGSYGLVTDWADVATHMHIALHSCASYWLDRIRGGKAEQSFAAYQRDLRLAMEQDQLAPLSGRSGELWHDGGWRSPLRADGGT